MDRVGLIMTPQEVYEHFGSGYKFRKQTKMSCTTLSNWLKWGYVPKNAQYFLQDLTHGKLKTEWTKEND